MPSACGDPFAEAELAREAHLRPVIDRLAVEADEAHVSGRDPGFRS